MLSPVTAIRAGRPRPRFAHSQPRHSEPRLGLPRRPGMAPTTGGLTLRPRAAIRAAARSLTRPPVPVVAMAFRLVVRRSTRVSWTKSTVDGLRVAREGSAAAWRA